MTKARQHPEVTYNGLKSAFRHLNKLLGGTDPAAMDTRVAANTLSEYQSPTYHDRHAPLDVVIDLEAVAGDPVVTKALCKINGGVFLKTEIDPAAAVWNRHLAKISQEVADVVVRGNEALVGDNEIDPAEAVGLLPEVDQAIDVLMTMRAALMQKASGEPS